LTLDDSTKVENLLREVSRWASSRSDIAGVVLVGSYARAEPTLASDVDLVIICEYPQQLLADDMWVLTFGSVAHQKREDWGKVQSVRAQYTGGLEVEFGVAGRDWIDQPLDHGTEEVLNEGVSIIFDRDGYLASMLAKYITENRRNGILGEA